MAKKRHNFDGKTPTVNLEDKSKIETATLATVKKVLKAVYGEELSIVQQKPLTKFVVGKRTVGRYNSKTRLATVRPKGKNRDMPFSIFMETFGDVGSWQWGFLNANDKRYKVRTRNFFVPQLSVITAIKFALANLHDCDLVKHYKKPDKNGKTFDLDGLEWSNNTAAAKYLLGKIGAKVKELAKDFGSHQLDIYGHKVLVGPLATNGNYAPFSSVREYKDRPTDRQGMPIKRSKGMASKGNVTFPAMLRPKVRNNKGQAVGKYYFTSSEIPYISVAAPYAQRLEVLFGKNNKTNSMGMDDFVAYVQSRGIILTSEPPVFPKPRPTKGDEAPKQSPKYHVITDLTTRREIWESTVPYKNWIRPFLKHSSNIPKAEPEIEYTSFPIRWGDIPGKDLWERMSAGTHPYIDVFAHPDGSAPEPRYRIGTGPMRGQDYAHQTKQVSKRQLKSLSIDFDKTARTFRIMVQKASDQEQEQGCTIGQRLKLDGQALVQSNAGWNIAKADNEMASNIPSAEEFASYADRTDRRNAPALHKMGYDIEAGDDNEPTTQPVQPTQVEKLQGELFKMSQEQILELRGSIKDKITKSENQNEVSSLGKFLGNINQLLGVTIKQ